MSSTTETVTTPEVVFIHNQSRASTIWSKSNSHEREETNIVTEEQSSNLTNPEASPREIPDTILCVLWKNYKIGAAYYKISESQVSSHQTTLPTLSNSYLHYYCSCSCML